MTKIYTLEVIKESRALLQDIEAENINEAIEKVCQMDTDGTITWAQKDYLTTEVINTREKK